MKGNSARFARTLNRICIVLLTGYALLAPVSAQVLPSFPSTKINPDHSITFRYRDPGATAVLCSVENVAKPLPMHKDVEGVWTITSAPLPAGIYRYHFEINGISFLDPANPVISNSLMRPANMVTVPGDGPQLGTRPLCLTAQSITTPTPPLSSLGCLTTRATITSTRHPGTTLGASPILFSISSMAGPILPGAGFTTGARTLFSTTSSLRAK